MADRTTARTPPGDNVLPFIPPDEIGRALPRVVMFWDEMSPGAQMETYEFCLCLEYVVEKRGRSRAELMNTIGMLWNEEDSTRAWIAGADARAARNGAHR